MISFKNQGLIDINAVTTFGVSVKETTNPIGYFGTGLKYAIAVILRNGGKITIWRGLQAFHFTLADTKIRGQDFRVVCMSDNPHSVRLGFTTELGKNWEMWMAFREIWCNCYDENEPKVKDGKIEPREGYTVIHVEHPAFDGCYQRRSEYILESKPIYVGRRTEAHRNSGNRTSFFYRGVKVFEFMKPTLFTYNQEGTEELTEDRTLKYAFKARWNAMSLILSSDDEAFISEALTADSDYAEADFNYTELELEPSKTFMETVGRLRESTMDVGLNDSARILHKKKTARSILPTESVPLDTVQQKQFDRAVDFVHRILGCDMEKFPIIVAESLGPGHIGRAENQTIYVAKSAFNIGTKYVAAALLEEFTHLQHNVRDETPEQKHIYLQMILSLGERLDGEPL